MKMRGVDVYCPDDWAWLWLWLCVKHGSRGIQKVQHKNLGFVSKRIAVADGADHLRFCTLHTPHDKGAPECNSGG